MGVRVSCPIFQEEGLDAALELLCKKNIGWRKLVKREVMFARIIIYIRVTVLKRLKDRRG